MESYPSHCLAHLAPLVLIQGLDSMSSKALPTEAEDLSQHPLNPTFEPLFRKHPTISEMPFVEDVVKVWRKYHIDGVMWDSGSTKSQMPTHAHRYRFKAIDLSHALPIKSLGEPSPLSIGNSASPVYPNGILTEHWLQKYRSIQPSLFIAFYEMDAEITDPQDIERIGIELASEINILKDQLEKRTVRLLVIVTSSRSTALNPDLEERVNTIRRMTNLNSRSGLLFLPSSDPKEVTTFALDVLQIIKVASTEFYTNLDKKVKRKRAKVMGTVSSDMLDLKARVEARYSLKLGFINEIKQQYDYAIKAYETGYESLVEVLNKLPINDTNWDQFRLLLDLTIFHIVRIYFYLELPNVAYRKFDVHIQSVLYILKLQKVTLDSYSVCNWLSLQFKWLAQLSDLAPVSLVPSEVPYKLDSSNRVSPLVLPHAGYLYLQSADILRRREIVNDTADSSPDKYSSALGSKEFQDSLMNLLTFSKLAFQKKDNTFPRSIGYVNFQLAEENFKLGKYEKAFKLYEQASDTLKEDDWSHLLGVVHCKLFECCVELKKHYPSVLNLLELGLVPQTQLSPAAQRTKDITNFENGEYKRFFEGQDDVVINAPADSSLDLFDCEVLFRNDKVPLTKDSELQLKLRSKLNDVLDAVVLDDLLLTFEGTQIPVLLKHDDYLEEGSTATASSLKLDGEKDYWVGSANLHLRSYETKVVKIVVPTKKIGRNTLANIVGVMDYHNYFKVNVNIPIVTKPLEYRHIWCHDTGIEDIIATTEPAVCEVVPRTPETKVTIQEVPKFVVSGERLSLPVKVHNIDHETVDISVLAVIVYGETERSCHWGDDLSEAFEIRSIETDQDIASTLSLVVPEKSKDEPSLQLTLKIKTTFIVDGDADVPITDIQEFTLPLYDPLNVSLTILPRLKDNDLPRAFEIKDGDTALPKPSRFWLMRAIIAMNAELDLEFVGGELDLESESSGMICKECVDLRETKVLSENKIELDHFVETIIEDGHTYRNISFDACIKLRWRRKGSHVNEYNHEPWKLSLPLLDPRVLLDVEPSEENNDLKLVYQLENPTTRVFSFSTTLIENQSFQVTGTKSLSQISVLPCTRQEIVFHATPLASGWVQLPQLKVHDLNYRVNLPTLPISDLAQTHKNEVYVNVDGV